jgi:lipopolysaccharide export system protein LptA
MRNQKLSFFFILHFAFLTSYSAYAAENINSVNISADDSIEWQQATNKLIASGNAKASKGDMAINSNYISAVYVETKDGNRDITTVEAKGNVKITSPENKAVGKYAKYDVTKKSVFISGSPAVITRKKTKETISAYKGIEYKQTKGLITATGKVKAVKNNHVINADTLKAYLKTNKSNDIKSIEAIGNVSILNGKEKITCKKAVYNPKTEIAELFGPITIIQGKNVLKGSYATFNLKTGISKMLSEKPSNADNSSQSQGRVKGVFMPAN